jgi:uncharacterized protein (DUF433 family)
MPTTETRITKTPGVCGGDACVRGHRIPVWVLMSYRWQGLSDADLLNAYPSITSDDLRAAWEYAAENPEEIEKAIRENEDDDNATE